MYRHSLRKRVAIAFAICVAVLSIAWGLAFFGAIRLSEDRVLTQQLQVAAKSYPDLAMNLRGYDEVASLPQTLRAWAQTNPAEGLYEFEAEELHVAVIASDNKQQKAFVVFDVAGIEAAPAFEPTTVLPLADAVEPSPSSTPLPVEPVVADAAG